MKPELNHQHLYCPHNIAVRNMTPIYDAIFILIAYRYSSASKHACRTVGEAFISPCLKGANPGPLAQGQHRTGSAVFTDNTCHR